MVIVQHTNTLFSHTCLLGVYQPATGISSRASNIKAFQHFNVVDCVQLDLLSHAAELEVAEHM